MTGSGSSGGMSDIGLSKSSTGQDTGFCITCSTNSSMDKYWHQWIFQGMGTRGLTGGSKTRGSGSGSVDMGQGVSARGGRSSTRGGFIGSGRLLMRSGGIALGNIMGGWSLSTGSLSGRRMVTGSGERLGKKYGGL